MSSTLLETDGPSPSVPSMLDLVRLSPRLLFPPGGVDLYRQIARLAELKEGDEVLDVACGKGVPLEYFAREHGVHGSGVDVDGRLVEATEARLRGDAIASHLTFQTGRSDALPYRDEIFDVVVGEIGLASHCSPEAAVRELVRVAKPGGVVVLVQLVWKAPVDEARQRILSLHLGARPLMLVEWKRLLRGAGVSGVHTENWSDDETAFRPRVAKPFPDFAEIFSLTEKIGILRRAWKQWGWRGVRAVLAREREVHRLLTRERILGLDLLVGRKGPPAEVLDTADAAAAVKRRTSTTPAGPVPERPGQGEDEDEQTVGLPLFGGTRTDREP